MQNRRLVLVFLVIFPMIFGLVLTPDSYSNTSIQDNDTTELPESISHQEYDKENAFALSQDSKEGIIDPVQIRESGFQETDAVKARTDTGTNTIQNITIDEGNGWFANYTEIEVSNIKRLYGVNGTFEDGIDPWTNYTIDGGSNTQITDYDSDGEYIICRNVGEYKWAAQHTWEHSANTEIGWVQSVNNTEGKLSFNMKLDFRYATGPIDPEGDNGFGGDIGVFYQVDNGVTFDGWYYPMEVYVDSRDAWYSLDHDFILPAAWSVFNITVGLWLAGDITLNNVTDYDDDPLGLPDGIEHAQNLTLYLDNVEFTGIEVPTVESVDLTFHAGVFSEAITGSGVGTASISNPNDWTTNPLEVQITSNTTVVFTYSVTTFYHHYVNSSWTTDLSEYGVSYSIDTGQSADLEMYTYITSSSDYENRTLEIELPIDWENTTILDPLQNDITGLCNITSGKIFVPNSLFDRVGWWKITHQAFNYAKNISIQIYETGAWTAGSLFRPGNLTRTQVELGTASETPSSGSSVTIDWVMPNGTIWSTDSVSSIVSGIADSSSLTFGGMNTSAGLWEVHVFWNNGTELAYGFDTFDLYHQASATVQYPSIETDHGLVIANQIVLTDTDNGEYLLDDSVSMSANWSSATVDFTPNFAKNWWQADFDTALLENGLFTVIVDITRPYFDPITVQFTVISTFETSLTITNAGPGSVENDLFDAFTVQLSYELLNGTGIEGALPSVTHTGPHEGIEWGTFIDIGNGLYSLDIISNISTTYKITITLSKPYNYNASDSFTLSINEISTELILVNGTADVVQYGDSYRLVVEYRNSTGYGLTDATLQIVTITPSTGLTNGSFTHITGGYYEITFTPTSTGTYSIVISAEILNHETQFTTFTLTGVVIPTVLTSIPSSVSITVNETFILQLNFEDESSNPIDTGTIELIDPPSGISVSSATWVGNGLYNITIRSSEIDIYNLLFRATATNYQSSIVGFTVSVTALPTILDITNVGTIPVESGLNEVFTVQLSYELLNGTGVAGALPIFVFSGPAEGLLWDNFTDSENGLYSIDIICNVSATYGITITMTKPYYYNTTDSFTLIIGETGSELELLNGTADVVLFSDSYRLVIEYRNSTGHGLLGADVLVMTVTPETGLLYTNFSHISDGYYEITFTPSAAGTFSIVISANITNHETQYTTFTLTASGIPTILTSLPSEKTVAVNQTYTLQLRFIDESLNPIDAANISVINPPVGVTIEDAISVGGGYYNITVQSSIIQTYDLLFRATSDNYQSSSAGFTFVVTEIQTTLSFEDDVTSTVVEFAEPFELVVYYDRSDPTEAVQGANITVIPAVADLDIHVVEYTGYYIVTITGDGVGSWALTIVADKTDHRVATKSFFIEVEEIDTTVQGSSPLETLFIGHSYDFTFSFIFESNSSYIPGATISPFGAGADWVIIVELGSGQYSVNLTPQELGEHSVILTFDRIGFETASFRLTFNVGRVPITVEVIQGISAPEYSESILTIRVIESDSGNPVSGVQVFCYIIDPNGASSSSIAMTETDTVGVYSTTIPMPIAEGQYQLQIICDGANYVMSTEFSVDLEPERDFTTMLWVTTTQYYPIILLFAALGFGLVYRRSARKKRIRENKETLAIKKRFDDIRSLMGVIVLHKDSGLPIYSKILRDGLEETVISAFITAITSFRGEFDIETSSEEWGLIPISDIVRVISTNKLVCAFITTGNPSPEQRERMIQFAKTVGFIFDDTMEDVPIVVLDHHTTQQFNSLFEDLLDGQLLRTYKLDDEKKFPTTSCANERIARRHGDEFKLEELATEIASCGLEEGRVYKAIMVALESQFLVTTDDSPFATELLRAPDIVEEES